jgi:PAS domain S-box-containing protein
MIQHVKNWLAPPIFPTDEAATRRAGLLNAALINIMTLVPVLVIGNALGGRTPLPVFVANAAAVALCLVLRGWMHRGRVRLASIGLMALGFVLITGSAASLGTIRTPTAAMYLLLVIIAGLLFDLAGMLATTALCALAIGGLIVAGNAGRLPQPDYTVTITQWVAYTALCGWAGSLTLSALRALRQAVARAEHEAAERKQASEQLRESAEQYRALFEYSVDAILLTAPDGRILAANPAACRMLGRTEVEICQLGRGRVVDPTDPRLPGALEERKRTGRFTGELTFLRRDGERFPGEISTAVFQAHDGAARTSMIIRDITERKRAEEEIQRHIKSLGALSEASLAFTRLQHPEDVGKRVIATLEQMLSWQRGSLWLIDEARQGMRLLAHGDMGLAPEALARELERVRSLVCRVGDGMTGWVAQHGQAVRSGNVKNDPRYLEADPAIRSEMAVPLIMGGRAIGVINVESREPDAFSAHDERLLMTLANQVAIAIENARLYEDVQRELAERRQAEERLRALAAHQLMVREEESSRIARAVHDELGQALTGLKMDLSWLGNQLAAVTDPAVRRLLREKAQGMAELTGVTINTVRRITAELRPGVLDDLGLVAALEWQAQDFERRSGIRCEFTSALADVSLDRSRATELFRICQEALTNVARHADASRVNVSLDQAAGQLILQVRDNGRGIPADALADPHAFGLLGMAERARLAGGDLTIGSQPGQGATVTVRVPLG